MDFIISLPKYQGKECNYVVVEKLTKYAHLFTISNDYKAPQVVEIFCKKVLRLHGLLKNIISDRDSHFLNTFWKELFHLIGTKITHRTSYYPQSDGKIEIVSNWLEGFSRNYVTS